MDERRREESENVATCKILLFSPREKKKLNERRAALPPSHLQQRKVVKLFSRGSQLFRLLVRLLLPRYFCRLLARLKLLPTKDFTVPSIPI
jgi:hypothetical protein